MEKSQEDEEFKNDKWITNKRKIRKSNEEDSQMASKFQKLS